MREQRVRSQTGFTVVETIIVLAIAGIILLIVLLAIPALQRSSRNNQRKQDVQAILGAVSHYELNNSGDMPDASLQLPKLSYYSPATVNYYNLPAQSCQTSNSGINITFCFTADWTYAPAPGASVNGFGANKLNDVLIYNHQRCDPDNSGHATNADAGFNNVVALYAIESGNSGSSLQCQQL